MDSPGLIGKPVASACVLHIRRLNFMVSRLVIALQCAWCANEVTGVAEIATIGQFKFSRTKHDSA